MNDNLAKYVLRFLTTIRRQHVWSSLAFLEESQWWSLDRLKEYQNDKLQRLLLHCYDKVPYYRKWFRESGYKPLDIDIDTLHMLPAISKANLRENMQQFIAEDYSSSPVEEAKTSGSTGISLHFPKSLSASASQLAAMYRGHRWHDVEPGAKEARLWGIHVNKSSRYKMHIRDVLLNRFREREYNLSPDTLNDFTVKLKKRKPRYLMGYTSMVSQYAGFLKSKGYDGREFNLKMVKCTSEVIHDRDRRLIESVFGCPLVGEFGAAETGMISFQCAAGSHHIMADCCIVEFAEPEETLDEKGLKELIVTNLDNYALPIVRYRVGDFALPLNDSCTCGRQLPLMDRIVGRVSDVIRTSDGGRWHSIILYYIMKGLDEKFGGVIQFKVFQRELDKLDFLIVPEGKISDEALEYLNHRCREHFGETMRVNFEIVDSIPREKSGKLRDFVSEL